ncbi:MAG TPA: hypothetical protein VGN55_19040 [Xanthobacteraceae bacterium]
MKKQLAIWAGLWLIGLGAAGTAGAQAVYAGPGLSDPALPPYEIMSIVRSTGLAPLTRPMRRGPYYVLVAVDRVGRQMRVVVDAQLGDIVNLRPALAAGSYSPEFGRPYGPPGVAAAPPDTTGATGYGARPGGDPRPSGDPRSSDPYATHPSAENALPPTPPRPLPSARVNAPPPSAAAPPPSAAAPPPSAAPPPTRLAVAEPALPPPPPLPRPRPKVALNEAPAASPAEALAPPPPPKPAVPTAAPSAAANAADEAAKSIE